MKNHNIKYHLLFWLHALESKLFNGKINLENASEVWSELNSYTEINYILKFASLYKEQYELSSDDTKNEHNWHFWIVGMLYKSNIHMMIKMVLLESHDNQKVRMLWLVMPPTAHLRQSHRNLHMNKYHLSF